MGKRIAAALLGVTLSLSAGAANATFPGTNARIAFVSDRDGNFEIYAMTPDGSEQTRLTTSEADERNPSWSPEGRRIAYDRDALIGVLADDASYDVQVRTCFYDSHPSWSPTGTRHVLYRQYGKTPYLLTRDVNGQSEDMLEGVTVSIGSPEWSPDGQAIVFEHERAQTDSASYSALWLIDPDGSNARQLTEPENNDSMPSWHPGSNRIAFASERDGNLEIYAMDVDGSDILRLTNDPSSDFDPAWSPDGSKIAFISDRDGDHEVFVMDADGTNVQQLTDNDSREADPDWQAIPTASSVPRPPEGPVPSCVEHVDRSITIRLAGHLSATGRIEQNDDDSRCSIDIRIQRRTQRGWKTVSRPSSISNGRYEAVLPDAPGRYRAKLVRSVAGFYTDRYRDICSAAVTNARVHRH